MSWVNTALIEELEEALDTFNWSAAEASCRALSKRIYTEADPIPERIAKRVLQGLRRKRRFLLMAKLAESLIQSGQSSPQIRRQYAQALIDQGILTASELVLQTIIQDSQGTRGEEIEARGLIGRIYKQLYINVNDSSSPRNRGNLEKALNEYLYAYRLNPQQNLWHGINVVALLERARRDSLPLQGLPDALTLAQEISSLLEERERQATEPLPVWDIATQLEALVALGRQEDAEDKALEYAACKEADAFEIASTLRQFTEVWQLDEQHLPGSRLLPILRAALLRREGAFLDLKYQKVKEELATVEDARIDLEKIFGADRTQTLSWYRKGLKQCESIARIETLDEKGHGTGWLVKASDFFPGRTGYLLLTNAHVVSSKPNNYALLPSQACANFQVLGTVCEVDEVIWSSPLDELDASFLSLKGDAPQAEPLSIDTLPVRMTSPPQRTYIIGYPGGRNLEFSLQDNHLLACNERVLHYRTPTEPGSSGSPVFEDKGWRVIALHHSGKIKMERIDGVSGTYEANEGIAIAAIQQATQNS